ncbi:MAG TPA: efflux RND transporter periplasmic adaptor subunit [Noviherbaspirillum sp.]|nr:efflux RND transporter periplasmic adaptor subunit [Noviherbaspirillum sp.]
MKLDDAITAKYPSDGEAGFFALLQPLLSSHSLDIAATEFLSGLAQAFNCERASLGFVDGNAIKVCAISQYYQQIKPSMLPELQAAMQESVLQDVMLAFPHPPSDFPYIVLAHAKLVQTNGLASAFTVPFGHDGRIVGAITLEKRHEQHMAPEQLSSLSRLANHASPLLALKWSLEQPLRARWWKSIRQFVKEGREKSRRIQLVAALLVTLLVLAVFVVPVSHQVVGQARLEASVQRMISAPIDGYLKEVRVRPGDRVQAQQLLAELNDETLLTEKRRLEAEALQQENALAEAMVKADRPQVVLRRAKLDEVVAQKDLVTQQLERIQLVAPFDGVVINGDLTQLLGSPMKRGDVLFTLSEGTDFRVMVEVPERDIADIEVGQRGQLVLTALPAENFTIRVVRITPVAGVSADGQNIFEIEAALENKSARLVPGLKGAAKIAAGDKPFGWKWVVRAWHTLSFFLWSRVG